MQCNSARWRQLWHAASNVLRRCHTGTSSSAGATALEAQLVKRIRFNGPMTVASYMRECLTHPQHGYYTTRPTIFGASGDFITAPQISPVFGELIGVWIAHQLQQQDARPFRLAELGPGDGRLLCDIMRTLTRLSARPVGISLLEASAPLRKQQAQVLAAHDLPVKWCSSIDAMLSDDTRHMIVAQEFLDALPVHVFQRESVDAPWRERLVDVDRSDALQFVAAKSSTSALALLDSVRCAGRVAEICADALAIVETIGMHVGRHGGAFLVVDYGREMIQHDTLRGVAAHRVVHALWRAGEIDVTADVNFGHLRQIAQRNKTIRFVGSVSQRQFLLRMGAAQRFRRLAYSVVQRARDDTWTDDKIDAHLAQLQADYDRLVATDGDAMGQLYRVAAICPKYIQNIAGFS